MTERDIDVTPETTALAPTGSPRFLGSLALTDPKQLRAQLTAYTEGRKTLIDWVYENLVPGTDWQLMHRKLGKKPNQRDCPNKAYRDKPYCPECHAKATLCKPGDEKINGLLQLTNRFKRDLETWEMLGSQAGILCLICEKLDRDGNVVSEGRGCRDVRQDYEDINKSIKMVQKSASIDATLRYAGLSELFTLDLDDMPVQGTDEEPREFQPPRRKSQSATSATETSSRTIDDDEPRDLAAEMRAQEASGTPPPPAQAPEASPAAQQSLGDVPPPPKDAISTAQGKRLYAIIRSALKKHNADTMGNVDRVKAKLRARYALPHLDHLKWRDYDEACSRVDALAEDVARP